jgi:hypothetical protein
VHCKYIPIYVYIQQYVTLHSLFVSGNCSKCFGWYFHPSSGAHTTVSTASGICHTFTAIGRYRGRVGTGLSVLWVACGWRTPPTAHSKDIHKEMLPIWAVFICGYPLLHPYFLPTKNAQRHAVLSWYMYSGASLSCNSCYVCTVTHTDRCASQ